jgi:hypothetical protein
MDSGEGMVTMVETTTVERGEWDRTLAQLTKDHEGEHVTIEIVDPSLGDQPEAERLPFSAATYDHKDDVVVIAVGGRSPRYPVVLRHIINHPTELDVAQGEPIGTAVRVLDTDGTTTLVTFYADPGRT